MIAELGMVRGRGLCIFFASALLEALILTLALPFSSFLSQSLKLAFFFVNILFTSFTFFTLICLVLSAFYSLAPPVAIAVIYFFFILWALCLFYFIFFSFSLFYSGGNLWPQCSGLWKVDWLLRSESSTSLLALCLFYSETFYLLFCQTLCFLSFSRRESLAPMLRTLKSGLITMKRILNFSTRATTAATQRWTPSKQTPKCEWQRE